MVFTWNHKYVGKMKKKKRETVLSGIQEVENNNTQIRFTKKKHKLTAVENKILKEHKYIFQYSCQKDKVFAFGILSELNNDEIIDLSKR